MAVTTWNVGDAINYVEIVSQAFAVADGGGVKNIFNVYHFRRTSVVPVLTKAAVEAIFQTSIMTPVLAAVNEDYTQTQVTIRWFEDATDPPVAFTETGIGLRTGERLPDFNAAVIQLKTLARGKGGRGSKHYGPITEGDTTGDALNAATITRFTAIGNAIVNGFTDTNGNVWVPGLKAAERADFPAHYTSNPTTTVWTDITSMKLNKTLGTMKRRKVATLVA